MKSIIKLSLAILLITTITTGCKKYEDGPSFSLLTKKARISGDWLVDNITYNGNDVTSFYTLAAGANFKFIIEKSGSYRVLGNLAETGKWKFGEDKDDVYLTSDAAGSTEQAFRILRLKNKELWLRSTASNGDVTIYKYVHEKD